MRPEPLHILTLPNTIPSTHNPPRPTVFLLPSPGPPGLRREDRVSVSKPGRRTKGAGVLQTQKYLMAAVCMQ